MSYEERKEATGKAEQTLKDVAVKEKEIEEKAKVIQVRLESA